MGASKIGYHIFIQVDRFIIIYGHTDAGELTFAVCQT